MLKKYRDFKRHSFYKKDLVTAAYDLETAYTQKKV